MIEAENPGDYLVQELLWIHGVIRADLATVRRLATEIRDGKDPQIIRSDIDQLRSKSPLWQLKVNCLYYCRLVHAHHGGEDAHIFPAIRRSDPMMEPVVDKLEADHRKVSDILDEVEVSANALVKDNASFARKNLIDALSLLSEHLLAHLDYEEKSIAPTLRSWRSWPFL